MIGSVDGPCGDIIGNEEKGRKRLNSPITEHGSVIGGSHSFGTASPRPGRDLPGEAGEHSARGQRKTSVSESYSHPSRQCACAVP